jgi:hypothetical protein
MLDELTLVPHLDPVVHSGHIDVPFLTEQIIALVRVWDGSIPSADLSSSLLTSLAAHT